MTQEEKAKAYDEALKCAKMYYKENKDCNAGFLPIIFPELAESEDERMKRIIMKFVWGYTNTPHSIINGDKSTLEYAKEVEAYLEKQEKEADERLERVEQFRKEVQELGEEMASLRKKIYGDERIEPHYTKRNALFDKCVENCDPEVMKRVSDEIDEMLEKEQKPAEWEDYKDKVNIPYCSSEPEWSEEDKNKIERLSFLVSVVEEKEMISPSESIDLRNFIKSLRPQQKQEWSEEDENMLWNIISIVGKSKSIQADEMLDWLKSLRPSWKPSEEQMEYLAKGIIILGEEGNYKTSGVLNELHNDLKKLL